MIFTIGSFVFVTALVAFISWLKTRNTDETNKDGYFLGGRSLTGWVIFGSLMMTNLSAEQLVGRNGQGYAAGMTAMGWETMCPIALTLMALFFVPKYFKLGISTIPEFLEDRYDRENARDRVVYLPCGLYRHHASACPVCGLGCHGAHF